MKIKEHSKYDIKDTAYDTFTIPNGLRVVCIKNESKLSYVALQINAGTQHEPIGLDGISHFTEHMLFKGTQKRSMFKIMSSIDAVGGELNAYTTKEEICIYSTQIANWLDLSLDVIHDVTFNSLFPLKEIEKEKNVIVDEIKSYRDSPAELIFDDFETHFFANSALSKNILGTEETVASINYKNLKSFYDSTFIASNMILCVYSPYDRQVVEEKVKKYFNEVNISSLKNKPVSHKKHDKTFTITQEKEFNQLHAIVGVPAPSAIQYKRNIATLLCNFLAGPPLNSILNLKVREKYGFTYHLESNYVSYHNEGIFSIYFATDYKKFELTKTKIFNEIEILASKKLTDNKLNAYKQQMIGAAIIVNENKISYLNSIAKSMLHGNKIQTLSVFIKSIEDISSQEIQEFVHSSFAPSKISTLAYY
jgi:predicted Zn-dependent peptidase